MVTAPENREILHVDLNGFFASVECFLNPSIQHLPVAVAGDTELRHGIILAKNELAKKYKIITGEPIWQAKRKCPELVTVKPHNDRYLEFSKLARDVYDRFTDQVESFSVDECWMDVTGSTHLFGSAEKIANDIRSLLHAEIGITASVGVSWNKIFAKLGSDYKKPDATTVISRENYKETVWRLPVSDLLYVGPATAKKLKSLGIYSIGDLANADLRILTSFLGKWGVVLQRFAHGRDHSAVARNGAESYIKSIGNSTTTPRDLKTVEEVKSTVYMLSDSVAARLREHGLKCRTVKISVRDSNMFWCERQAGLDYPTFITSDIAKKAMDIFGEKYRFQSPIRNVGVRAANLESKDAAVQLDLFGDVKQRIKRERAEEMMDGVRGRFGSNAMRKGILYEDIELTNISPKDDHLIHPLSFFNEPIPH